MNLNSLTRNILIGAFLVGAFYTTVSDASNVFTEDFESDLSLWTGKGGGAHQGTIVSDPIRPENNVLSFTGLNNGGDIYTVKQIALTPGRVYNISFEYLGLPQSASVTDNLGGFAGLSEGLPGSQMWYYGTAAESYANDVLIDDGEWHTYFFDFSAPVTFAYLDGSSSGSNIRLTFEDWAGTGGIAGDVYFDNIRLDAVQSQLQAVPLPAAIWVFAPAILGLWGVGTKRRFGPERIT